MGFALLIHLFAKKVESFLFVSSLIGIKRNQVELFLLICLVLCSIFPFFSVVSALFFEMNAIWEITI